MAGLLAKSTVSRPTVVAAVVAGVLAVAAAGLPMHTSLLVATLVGILTGRLVPARTEADR
jgi:fructose-specific phosphotransferase system IIC component